MIPYPPPSAPSLCLACRIRTFATCLTSATYTPTAAAAIVIARPRSAVRRRAIAHLQTTKSINVNVPARGFGTTHTRRRLQQPRPGDPETTSHEDLLNASAQPAGEDDAAAVASATAAPAADDELVAAAARRAFGDNLPEGALTDEQYRTYVRLYGPPLKWESEEEMMMLEETDIDEDASVLFREGEDGELEEVEPAPPLVPFEEETPAPTDPDSEDTGITVQRNRPLKKKSLVDEQLLRDIVASVNTAEAERSVASPDAARIAYEAEESDELEETDTDQTTRTHPFTLAGRFGTSPSTLPLPRAAMTDPVALLLSNVANKHIDQAASKLLGGPSLPLSPSHSSPPNAPARAPVPLHPAQGRMSDIDADVYLAAVMPPTYASIVSALTEVRRRLGAPWLEGLLRKDGGPRILDAGAGGAGVLAWREVLKAEWHRMHEDIDTLDAGDTAAVSDHPEDLLNISPTPVGRATVLTASHALRQRAAAFLENTTFLPRLPDYVHAQFPDGEDAVRKQFDIIVAPHSLWRLVESHERKNLLRNLWNMLDPAGGVLVLLEKGSARGFDAIADARAYIISDLFEQADGAETVDSEAEHAAESSLATPHEQAQPQATETEREAGNSPKKGEIRRLPRRAPGRIIAPCPHESACPQLVARRSSRSRSSSSGIGGTGGKDTICRFTQRYQRPPYLQRLLGARHRNHEDVEYSYVAVQKVAPSPVSALDPQQQQAAPAAALTGAAAADRAFEGYELDDADINQHTAPATSAGNGARRPPALRNPLPRLVRPALKRQRHVHLDLCTPAGTLERWTVPRSFGRQAYRDARKARWGDLWALGGKHRERRTAAAGVGGGGGGGDADGRVRGEAKRRAEVRGKVKAGARRARRRRGEDGEDDDVD